MRLYMLAAITILLSTPTLAKDRAVTPSEQATLTAAVTAAGCSGGQMEFETDDNYYEVDHARCSDGRRYELKFNVEFRLFKKELEK